ncbi:hypothetical protein BDV36DRAFT_257121 [Aspergillus pseudocaelatus]|uniref:Uncharacterized protein n=1 Tax=Aspergillus pseudocaelatus TaxID=1825620 RepID=A0ABQ6WJK2_9EURO|nr:hypothetical protein BDV36DRAFT_257121 [Aspergillus pseudocaelatus]
MISLSTKNESVLAIIMILIVKARTRLTANKFPWLRKKTFPLNDLVLCSFFMVPQDGGQLTPQAPRHPTGLVFATNRVGSPPNMINSGR